MGVHHELKYPQEAVYFNLGDHGLQAKLICNKVWTRLVIQIFADYDRFPTFDFNFDCENPMQLCIF